MSQVAIARAALRRATIRRAIHRAEIAAAAVTEPKGACCDACARSASIPSVLAAITDGTPFEALIAVIGRETADKRELVDLAWGDAYAFPLRLRWQRDSHDGHNGAELVGEITAIRQEPDGSVIASGLLDNIAGRYLIEELRRGMPWACSPGIGRVDIVNDEDNEPPVDGPPLESVTRYTGQLIEVTVVSSPAEPNTWIRLVPEPVEVAPVPELPPDQVEIAASAAAIAVRLALRQVEATDVAAAATSVDPLVCPPGEWFEPFAVDHKFWIVPDGPERGRIFGIVAASACHLGLGGSGACVTPTSDGVPVILQSPGRVTTFGQLRTSPIISGIGHKRFATAAELFAHYADRDDAVGADVVYHWQADGSLAAFGAVRPGTTDEQIASWNASAISYHRTKIHRGQELFPGTFADRDGWLMAGACLVGIGGQGAPGSMLVRPQIAAGVIGGPWIEETPRLWSLIDATHGLPEFCPAAA